MLRVQSLGQGRVQGAGGSSLSCFFVLRLNTRTTEQYEDAVLPRVGRAPDLLPHLALQLRQLFSKLSVCGFRQLRVEALTLAPPAALLVLDLEEMDTKDS